MHMVAELQSLAPAVNATVIVYVAGKVRPTVQAGLERLLTHRSVPLVRVLFLGFVPHAQLPALLRSTDVVVIPSVMRWETFNLVGVEVMSAAVPVVSFCVEGMQDFCRHRHNVLVADDFSGAALARAVVQLVTDPPLAQALAANGRQFVDAHLAGPHSTLRLASVLANTHNHT